MPMRLPGHQRRKTPPESAPDYLAVNHHDSLARHDRAVLEKSRTSQPCFPFPPGGRADCSVATIPHHVVCQRRDMPYSPDLQQPIDQELWDHARPAIHALIDAAATYRDSGGWCLRADVPEIHEEQQFPWLSVKEWGDDRPWDWRKLFGRRGKPFTQIAVEDIPELMAWREYCAGRADLIGSLLPPEDFDLEWLSSMFIDHLTLDVFDRAMHLNARTPEDFIATYLEAERSVLAPSLWGDIVIPLPFTAFPSDDPLKIDSGVTIRRLHRLEHLARARGDSWGPVTLSAINAATHAIVMEGFEIDNTDPWRRRLGWLNGNSHYDLGGIDEVIRAMRIVVNTPLGYAQILLKPWNWSDHWILGIPAMQVLRTVRRYPDKFDERRRDENVEPLAPDDLVLIPVAYAALHRGDARLNLAARRLDLSRSRVEHDDQLIDCAVGLEALLGGDNRTELSHRIATRAAVLLCGHFRASAIYAVVRGVCDRRSEIVHGSHQTKKAMIKFEGQTWPAHNAAQWVLSELLKVAIIRNRPIDARELDSVMLSAVDVYSPPDEGDDQEAADTKEWSPSQRES
jgi:hypothetical protein